MQFNSLAFVLFTVLTVGLYYLIPRRWQWGLLLAASYVFYFFAGAECLLFILYTTVITYTVGRVLQTRADREDAYVEANRDSMEKSARKEYRAREKKKRLHILTLGLALGFGMLAVLKYTGFVLEGVNALLSGFGAGSLKLPKLLLPLGISFYTFQSMGYLIDVYRKKTRAETNFFRLALFVSFFPQLVQGPISRHDSLAAQLFAPHQFEGQAFRAGMGRVVWGFFKKMVVADTALIGVKTLAGADGAYTGVYVVLLILLYSVEIYADFTGGIDITIGLSQMLGIRLAENFDRPFSSRSTKEYWRRWHITMGTWFTDYIFYPLSVSNSMQRLSKWSRAKLGTSIGKRIPVYLATIVTWFLTGLWHGAGLNFIVWGLLNCAVILISQELQPLYNKWNAAFPKLVASRPWGAWQAIRTFLLMGLIRSLDCYRDVPRTFSRWTSIFTDWNWSLLWQGSLISFGLSVADWSVILCGVLIMSAVSRVRGEQPLRERLAQRPLLWCMAICLGVVLILVFGAYGIGFDASAFIYDQF